MDMQRIYLYIRKEKRVVLKHLSTKHASEHTTFYRLSVRLTNTPGGKDEGP